MLVAIMCLPRMFYPMHSCIKFVGISYQVLTHFIAVDVDSIEIY